MLNTTRWPYPRIIAHRGGGTVAPENTLVALRLAASLGFGGVEFDVKLAKFGVPVLLHDDTLERTSTGAGPVVDRDAAELRAVDAGSWFGNEFAGEHIPTFETASTLSRSLGLWANIEIKPDAANPEDTGRIVALLAARFWKDASPAPLLSSFSEPALRAARTQAPELPRALLVDQVPHDWAERTRALECRALHCSQDAITPDLVAAVHGAGLGLLAYTVNETGRALTLFEMGVDAIVTDELRDIRPDFLATFGLAR
ncbi:MAG: glycerophosphodiester phosphodiesterase [Betaproteobacteria bacterium]